jgi:nuclear GTP-binding protein
MSKSVDDPFNVVLKASKLPMSLLKDNDKEGRVKLLEVETFANTFGPKKLRKKPKLSGLDDLAALAAHAESKEGSYDAGKDGQLVQYKEHQQSEVQEKTLVSEYVFFKGTSKRIWAELYKVIDSSDVVLQVIDARDPMGTRNQAFERELRKNHPHKKLVLLLNKVDLVPAWAASRWTQKLSKEYPTVAFHASVTNPFGKSALIQLLRQFAQLLKQRQHVQIGLVGYPNVGKSSVIIALKMKKVCKAAPIPGETRVWQYISLTKKIFLIDCPGVVPPSTCDFAADSAKVLKGVVRAEKIENPSHYIPEVLERVKHKYILERYNLPKDTPPWDDYEDFLKSLALKMGKLRKGGDPDIEIVARIVLYDWQRGRIPFFTPPPEKVEDNDKPVEEIGFLRPAQAFKSLQCAVEFDPEDAAREATQDIEGDAVDAESDEDDGAEEQPVAEASAEKKKKKSGKEKPKADAKKKREEGAEKPKKRSAEEAKPKKRPAATEDAAEEPKKKRVKKARTEKAKPVAPSKALDWNAIASEFAS